MTNALVVRMIYKNLQAKFRSIIKERVYFELYANCTH